jgi:hypothetical protein
MQSEGESALAAGLEGNGAWREAIGFLASHTTRLQLHEQQPAPDTACNRFGSARRTQFRHDRTHVELDGVL